MVAESYIEVFLFLLIYSHGMYMYVEGGRETQVISYMYRPCSNVKLTLHSLDKLELVLNRQFLLYLLGFGLLVVYFSTLKMPLK